MDEKLCIYDSPIGQILIAHRGDALTQLKILGEVANNRYGCGVSDTFSDAVYQQILEYIDGKRGCFDIKIDISHTTPFQNLVLRELLTIPYAEHRTYGQIAAAIGQPKAARAVGMACNRNPIHIVIPCHRVIASNGSLTGYAAGIEIKRQLLNIESPDSSKESQ